MLYAEVSVNSPAAILPTFSYRIPETLDISPGQAVWVPFGRQILQGVVISTGTTPEYPETRDIAGLIEDAPVLSALSIKLGKWISMYYRCRLFQALALMLPPGFERRSLCSIRLAKNIAHAEDSGLNEREKTLLNQLKNAGTLNLKEIEKQSGARQAHKIVSRLAKLGLATLQFNIEPQRISPQLVTYLRLALDNEAALEAIQDMRRCAPKQAALLAYLCKAGQAVKWKQASLATGSTRTVMRALADKGFINAEQIETSRKPIPESNNQPEAPLTPNRAQAEALTKIKKSLQQQNGRAFLLYGITGSGKTEVYLQALAEAIKMGKTAIVLIPEISLTSQTIGRFTARFPNRVAVLHSRLSLGERFDQWREIKAGKYDVVVGPRSALFAPLPNPGLIVIDEEHEWSYKQDTSPRYHARNVAFKLSELSNATMILGSATPDVESFYYARCGKLELINMPDRLTAETGSRLPEIEIVDLRQELKTGNRSIFSRKLQESISYTLKQKEQVILFLNRRGGASFVQCRDCGHVINCRRCEVPMSYHFDDEQLVCHHCNYRQKAPGICPECLSKRIKYLGLGTQAVAGEVSRLFPEARVLRWDSDATRQKNSHHNLQCNFQERKSDILIGTQMIAKGLDFPHVSLVGVISADTSLNLPDFRAGERTFALLSQVAGRAGRSLAPGKVIIQSYYPEHYAVQAAARHDYAAFYNTEIKYRLELIQPPFSKLVRLTFVHRNDEYCQNEAERLSGELKDCKNKKGIAGVSILGPAPAFIHRLRGQYRWNIIIKGHEPALLLDLVSLPRQWKVDVDPYGLE